VLPNGPAGGSGSTYQTSEPDGRESAIFAFISDGQSLGRFSDEISDELHTQTLNLFYLIIISLFFIIDWL
jgi:hypothetical protein